MRKEEESKMILRLLDCMMGRRLMSSSVKDGFLMRVAGIMVRLKEELSHSIKPSTLFFQVTLSFSEVWALQKIFTKEILPLNNCQVIKYPAPEPWEEG